MVNPLQTPTTARLPATNLGDYYQIYPEDEYNDEMGNNARVWRVYNDEADRIDAEMVAGWRGTLDTLLIFAGLFSAVVATFVTQTTQNLQPDFNETTASLLTEMVKLQRAASIGGNASAIPLSPLTHDTTFIPMKRDIWLNGIWFVSLGLTLSTALITGMIKQWLHFYVADISGTPKDRASIRQFRYAGLSIWGVSPIIELLPVLMNASLLLFFVGLVLFTQGLTGAEGITAVVILMTCALFLFYMLSSVLPIWKPQCPYKTSLSSVFSTGLKLAWLPGWLKSSPKREQKAPEDGIKIGHRSPIAISEATVVSTQRERLLLDAIEEMVIFSTNTSVSDIALHSLAGSNSPAAVPKHLWRRIKSILWDMYPLWEYRELSDHQTAVGELLARALCFSPAPDWQLIDSFLAGSKIRNHRIMAVEGLSLDRGSWFLDKFMENILEQPPIETRLLHPLIHRRIIQGMVTLEPWYPPKGDSETILRSFALNLSPDHPPTLQEEIMFHRLYRGMQLQENGEGGMNLAHMREIVNQSLIPFIETLPILTKHFLSAGARSCDLLFKMLLKMRRGRRIDNHGFIHPSPWVENFALISYSKEALSALLNVLNQLLEAEKGWEEWEGSMHLRLHAILHLYFFLDRLECRASVREAMFHCYPLLLASWSDSEDMAMPDQAFLMDSETYFHHIFMYSRSPSTFQSFCLSFTSSHFPNLPEAFLSCIASHVTWALDTSPGAPANLLGSLQSHPQRMDISAGLDDLFRHFLMHREGLESNSAQREEGRYHTLSDLINIVIDSSSCFSHSLSAAPDRCWWKLFYSWLDIMEQELARFLTTRCDPIPTGHVYGEEDKSNKADDIAEDHPINADHLRELIDRIKGVLEQYPLPLPSSPGSGSSSMIAYRIRHCIRIETPSLPSSFGTSSRELDADQLSLRRSLSINR